MVKLNVNGVEVGNDELVFLPERGILPEVENTLTQVGGNDGSVFLRNRLRERTVPIKFVVKTMSRRDFEIAMSTILHSKEPVPLIFSDKPNEVWYGVVDGEIDLDRAYNIGKGTIKWLVPDGHSYSKKEKTATNNGTANTITFTNNGTDLTPVKITTEMKSDNGFLGLALNGRYYQVGEPKEVDGYTYDDSQNIVPGDPMPGLDKGVLNKPGFVVIPPDQGKMNQQGSLKMDGKHFIVADYGADPANKGAHGPSWTYELPADSKGEKGATNFTFRWHAGFGSQKNNPRQVGQLCATIHDEKGNALCSMLYNDLVQEKENFTVRYDINGKKYFEQNVTGLPDGYTGHAYIIKAGSSFTMCWGWMKPMTFICDELKNAKAFYVSYSFMQWKAVPVPTYFGLINWNFHKNYTDLYNDIPNFFTANDEVVLDSETNELTINDFKNWDKVDIGSKPLLATPGINELGIVVSDWAKMPNVTVEYRERWL